MNARFLLSLWFLISLLGYSNATLCSDSAALQTCIGSITDSVCTIAASLTNPDITSMITVTYPKLITTELKDTVTLTLNNGFLLASGVAVTVENMSITENPATPGFNQPLFRLNANAQIHLKNVHIHDIKASGLFWGQDGTGSWTNVTVSNFVSADGQSFPAWIFFVQDTVWNFTDVTWRNITTSTSRSMIRITQYFAVGSVVTFAGNQIFENIKAGKTPPGMINLQQDGAVLGPVIVRSDAQNPSKFVVRNSTIPFISSSAMLPNHHFDITLGSLDYVWDDPTPPTLEQYCHAFALDLPYYSVNIRNTTYSIKIIGDVVTKGLGFVSRGPLTDSGEPFNNAMDFSIGGDLNITVTSNSPSAFRLNWPASINAKSISINLEQRSDNLIAPVVFKSSKNFFLSGSFVAHSTISATNAFSIKSNPTYSIPSGPLFDVTYNNAMLTLRADTFSVSGVTRSTSLTSYNASYHGTVASVENGGRMEIITNGSMTFSSNENKFGAGGVFYIGNSVAATQPVLKLQTTTNGDIEFNGNTAYFGGVVYASGDTPNNAIEISAIAASLRPIKFVSNEAKSAGGVALIPQQMLTSLVPSGRTLFSGNGAFDFGCLFAYAETFSASNAAGNCPNPLNAQYSGNLNKSSSYQWATQCIQLDEVCAPGYAPPVAPSPPPSPPVAPPQAPPATQPCPSPAPAGANCVNGTWVVSSTSLPPAFEVDPPPSTPSTPLTPSSTPNAPSVPITPVYRPPLAVPVVIVGNVTVNAVTVTSVFQSNRPMISSPDNVVVKSITVELSDADTQKLLKDKRAVAILLRFVPDGTYDAASGINSRDHFTRKIISVDSAREDSEETLKGEVSKFRKDADSIASTQLTIQPVKTEKSCQKVKSTRNNSQNTLSVVFTVDESSCNAKKSNTWWIVLVSVVGGVILLAAIALVIIILLPSRYRAKLQPFHNSKDAPTRTTTAYTNEN